ncbi:MAG: transcription elongation factor GreB, partial [Alphaproteobacteria bacterium]
MSKAFTKESETDEEDEPELPEPSLPRGTKNYITPGGFKRLQEELRNLLRVERPKVVDVVSWAAGNG